FTDVTSAAGILANQDTWSPSWGDLNGDGWLDLVMAHWGGNPATTTHFWLNDGDGTFTASDAAMGYSGFPATSTDNTFAYNLTDLDLDGDLDVVCASDFITSHVYRNDNGTLANITARGVLIDDNGMGCTTGDYDNDGDLDWFVSSVYNAPFKVGNRLYENTYAGGAVDSTIFADVTSTAGVANGSWGWGSTFQDFDNDGWLDIYHVNGWRNGFANPPSRLFRNNQDKTFTNVAGTVNANHMGEGRGVVALDYDKDGDLDLFLANNDEQATLLRNDGLTGANYLSITLTGPPPNIQQVGAKVRVAIGPNTQLREIRCGNNYLSQDPINAHFGLGSAATADVVEVDWTDGTTTTLNNVPANQYLNISYPGVDAPHVSPPVAGGITLLGVAPNPFQVGTVIRFSLDQGADATVRVYDTAGRMVRTLSEGALPAGRQAVSWDGRDDSGRPVSSGVYWYKVSTADNSARGKVVLVR
ncbi:MAG TPA: FG-GAP-like repeat-containing protein, partial [bacterium]|nr:FG-GAP-like repeat-containing protein [bacterium]